MCQDKFEYFSLLDVDDSNWRFFLMFEKFKDSEGLERYAIAGYSTVYEYYAYPANKRPRISQVIIIKVFFEIENISTFFNIFEKC